LFFIHFIAQRLACQEIVASTLGLPRNRRIDAWFYQIMALLKQWFANIELTLKMITGKKSLKLN
jgi:hypothetical protein